MAEYFKRISVFLVLILSFSASPNLAAQDSISVSNEGKVASTNQPASDSTSIDFALRPSLTVKPIVSDRFDSKFKQTLKYDTTWNNPENRCYEFKQPISQNYLFLFKFLSKQQYEVYSLP